MGGGGGVMPGGISCSDPQGKNILFGLGNGKENEKENP